ncbi:MAG: alpha/beta hydrolase [Candidatus Izemoplasmatales bacterium]|nr:alpha/beta hydrolase [Candidatus Izemoplasmatales bacterium]
MWYLIIAFFIFLIFLYICLQIAFTLVLPKTVSLEQSLQNEKSKEESLISFYETKLSKQKLIKSRYGYNIMLYYMINHKNNKFVVIAHGHTYTHHGAIKYAKIMDELGYNVIMYDQRYHGLSGGKNCSLGYYEKYDLYDIITLVYEEFGDDIYLGTYGESMGGATVLLEQVLDERIDFVISDCSFSSLNKLVKEQLKLKHVPGFVLFFVGIFFKIITGIKMKEVKPIESVMNSMKPIMFVHGKQDKLIDYHHSEEMYNIHKGKKKLYIASGNAFHAQSYFSNPKDYFENVRNFLEEISYK